MRPVNLIPPEDRRGDKAPARTGPLAYVVVAVLAVALFAITALVLTANQISDNESEKADLENQVAAAQAEAQRFNSFADFAALQQARQETVTTLAQSRFDWERVLRELAIVIPGDVWLTGLSASVSPDAAASDSTSGTSIAATPENVQGPSLEIQGCASGHEAVARFLAALRDIDGVTRVSVLSSDKPEASSSAGGEGATDQTAGACSTRQFISAFQVVAAFDAVEIPVGTAPLAPSAPTATTPPASPAPAAATEGEATASAADQSQVSDSQQQLDQQKQSSGQQTQRGRKAVDTFVPGTGTAP